MGQKMIWSKSIVVFFGLIYLCLSSTVIAIDTESFASHKLAIVLSENNNQKAMVALSVASTVQENLGRDNVDIEIIAYGPGMMLLSKDSDYANKILSLNTHQGITFSACAASIAGLKKKTGISLSVAEGVRIVPGGVIRIMELDKQGYTIITP